MRSAELDRDMPDVIPVASTPDSTFLFERMTERTLAFANAGPGRRVLDVASGFGQDTVALAARGSRAIGAEPSRRMMRWARMHAPAVNPPVFVRAFGDALPFPDEAFDAAICKGALDHFDAPDQAIREMARVTKRSGRVVLAVANFEALACRIGRVADELLRCLRGGSPRGRRSYDVPADHFTRYDPDLLVAQASRHLADVEVSGTSLFWGLAAYARILARFPPPYARAWLEVADRLAGVFPGAADVLILVGRPKSPATPAPRTAR